MRILHITDFHFKSPSYSKFDQDKVVDKFINTLKGEIVDLVFFTGDLVFSGSNKDHFNDAFKALLEKIQQALNLNSNQIILCPGNHDTDRNKILQSLNSYFATSIKSSVDLDNFVVSKSVDYINSLQTIENYHSFIKTKFNHADDVHDELYSTHIRTIGGRKVGILAINTAWRSIGNTDEGNLLYPLCLIKAGLTAIEGCECKILLAHHPLHWFKGWNYMDVQSLVHSSFNMIFSGHIHQTTISSHYRSNNGIFAMISPASFSYEEDTLGFSIIGYDFNESEQIRIQNNFYSKSEGVFVQPEIVVARIPCGEKKEKQNQIRRKIISKYSLELTRANDLLLTHVESNDDVSEEFIQLFSDPILRRKSKAELTADDALNRFDFNHILTDEGNYWILGNDKSGKTSLLRRIQLYDLKNYTMSGTVPFYIDYKEFENKVIDSSFNIIRLIKTYYEINKADAQSITVDHKLRLLIDNYDPKRPLTDVVIKFLRENPKVSFVICSSLTSSLSVELQDFGTEYLKLFLHELGRPQVRSYAKKWKEIRVSEQDRVIEKIIALCKQLEIPINYWTISLFLLIHKKMNNDTSKNLFEILDLCVDEMLNKKYLVLTKSKVKFEQLKKISAELAHFLLIHCRENAYSASYAAILTFMEAYIKSNPRVSADSKEILDYLISSGVLKGKDDATYTFRLNGIFEYFLAYYLTLHEEFKQEIISNDGVYLSFKNELEIYSGLRNNNEAFLRQILEKTKKVFGSLGTTYVQNPDESLSKKIIAISEVTDAAIRLKSMAPFNHDLQDQLKEEINPLSSDADIHTKKIFDTSVLSADLLERYLSILARVFRNTDEVKDQALIDETFDFILDGYIGLGFYLIDEVNEISSEFWMQKDITEREINILKMLTNIIPIVTQVAMFDGLGHFNLEQIIKDKIEELKKEADRNQYKLFILHLLLVDIDIDKYNGEIDKLIELLNRSSLKISLVFKLKYYLGFKAYNRRELETTIRAQIQRAELKVDSKINRGSIQSELEQRTKRNLGKKSKEK